MSDEKKEKRDRSTTPESVVAETEASVKGDEKASYAGRITFRTATADASDPAYVEPPTVADLEVTLQAALGEAYPGFTITVELSRTDR